MEKQRNDLFQLTEHTLKKVRYIKLNKKASYSEESLEQVVYNSNTGKEKAWESVQLYSFGFYDSLTCYKPPMDNSRIDKESFLISYPFTKTANTLKAEQWFGILPLSEERLYWSGVELDKEADPFFCKCDLQEELPFVGVLLISLNDMPQNDSVRNFKALLQEYLDSIDDIFEEFRVQNKRYIAEAYYSLNCADLCLIMRTDTLTFVHHVNRCLYLRAKRIGCNINSTVIFSVQENASHVSLQKIAPQNKGVSFVVRSNQKYDGTSKGVNGVGRYVTIFEYEKYIEFLPQLFVCKLGKKDSSVQVGQFAQSICHEREWFAEENSQEELKPDGEDLLLQTAICQWITEVRNMVSAIEILADEVFSNSGRCFKYTKIFSREFRLVKDLVYSYSDLWYQNASDSGFAFFAQLVIALNGINSMLRQIEKFDTNDAARERSIERLFGAMHSVACDLNGYNKQFQFLNQDSVNFPSYEIQSKVNSEKYMAAYGSFLHKFFVLYYDEKQGDETIVQIFPLALADLNQGKIITNIIFSYIYTNRTKEENRDSRGMFAVHFPSSEYFSSVWDSVPLLMHEASHTQHYGETVNRNKAMVFNIDIFFAETLANKMLQKVNDGVIVHTSSLLAEVFKERVYTAIVSTREIFFEKIGGFENWTFDELLTNCKEFYRRLFDKSGIVKRITYDQLGKLREKTKKDVDHIMRMIDFEAMCYGFDRTVKGSSAMYYFVNELYLEFNSDFYRKFKEIYDRDFLDALTEKVLEENEDEIEQAILRLAWYRFVQFVSQHITRMPDSVIEMEKDMRKDMEEHKQDYLLTAFLILLMAGMRAIFGKYRKSFNRTVPEKEYCDNLIPESFPGNIHEFAHKLAASYQRYVSQSCISGEEVSTHDRNLMGTMFYEYYEIYLCINNVMHFLADDRFYVRDEEQSMADDFVKCLHIECKKYISEEEKKIFAAIFAKTNRVQLVRLGFFEDNHTIMKENFAKALADCGDTFVEDNIDDRAVQFAEVYADCGMCCAMGFDPFGYSMFALAMYNNVNDLGAANTNANFLADRLRAVIGMFFDKAEKGKWVDILGEFLHKLCDADMITAICDMLQLIGETEEIEQIYNYLQNDMYKIRLDNDADAGEEIFRAISKDTLIYWKDFIFGKLIDYIEKLLKDGGQSDNTKDKLLVAKTYLSQIYNVIQLFIDEDILPHIVKDGFNGFFQDVKKHMEQGKGINAIKNDTCVKQISQLYNMEGAEEAENKFEWYYQMCLKKFLFQCNFIFDHYCDYRDAYNFLKSKIHIGNDGKVNLNIGQWFGVIDDYYFGRESVWL